MARKGGRGGNKAARSAAAKKGWETRRRGGAKSKPAATKRTAATKAKGNEYGTGVVAQRKKAMSARLVAAGKGIGTRNPQQAAYIRAQNINIIGQRLASEGKGNKAARRAAQLATKAKAAKTTARRGMPKTTSARGRALTNQRRAADLVRASRGGKGPSAKAVRSVLTAQRARAFYAATGGGKKRSAVKAAGKKATAAKAAAVRSRLGGGGSVRPKVAGKPRAGAKPAAQRPAARPVAAAKPIPKLSRDQRIQANEAKMAGVKLAAYDLRAKLPKKKRDGTGRSTVGGLLLKISGREISRQQYGGISDLIGPRGIAGVRTRVNANGSISLSMSSVAKAQAMIGEKRATRPRRRRRS